MNKFHIVGAFDRHNYGDILFPLIHTRFIKNNGFSDQDILYYAITESDLSNIGGVKSKSIRQLIRTGVSDYDRIIMSGGETLGASWRLMICHLSSPKVRLLLRVLQKVCGDYLASDIIRMIYRQKNRFPYVLSQKHLSGKIYYTCVGGSRLNRHPKHFENVSHELKSAEHISVRDEITKNLLAQKGLHTSLSPDSALIISDLFPVEFLNSRPWRDRITISNKFSFSKYIVFQTNNGITNGDVLNITNQLDRIVNETNFSVILVPIGRAPGHEDHEALQRIYGELANNKYNFAFLNSPHVLDIMAVLANAKCYIGTSLHGAISAYSFGAKVCGISTRRVRKLHAFLKTWVPEMDCCSVNDYNFYKDFKALVSSGTSITDRRKLYSQKTLVYNDLSKYI